MFQKLKKKVQAFLEEKGQGTVEYALILGFVAILAVYLLTGSNLTSDAKKNVSNANEVATAIDAQYSAAKSPTTTTPTQNP